MFDTTGSGKVFERVGFHDLLKEKALLGSTTHGHAGYYSSSRETGNTEIYAQIY